MGMDADERKRWGQIQKPKPLESYKITPGSHLGLKGYISLLYVAVTKHLR